MNNVVERIQVFSVLKNSFLVACLFGTRESRGGKAIERS